MKKSIIAALMSLLVFPGTGHVWLKKTKLGMSLIFISMMALLVSIAEIFKVIMRVLNDINSGRINIDPELLTATIMENLHNGSNNSSLLNTALTVLIVCWIFSTLDAFRIGLQKTD